MSVATPPPPAHIEAETRRPDVLVASPEDQDAIGDLVAQVAARWTDGVDALPPFPPLAGRLVGMLAKGDLDVREVVKVIGLEPTVAAGVLRAANSAALSRGIEIDNLRKAVVRLGPRGAAQVALALATRQLFNLQQRAAEARFAHLQTAFWRHALTVAFAASGLAVKYRKGDPERVLVAGMLHDVGKNVALALMAEVGAKPRDVVALFVCHEVHEAFGEELARRWGLPRSIVEACAHHHRAHAHRGEHACEVQWVRVASLADRLNMGPVVEVDIESELQRCQEALGVDANVCEFVAHISGKVADLSR